MQLRIRRISRPELVKGLLEFPLEVFFVAGRRTPNSEIRENEGKESFRTVNEAINEHRL